MGFGVEEAEEPGVMKGRSFSCALSLSRKEEPALAGDTPPPTKVGTLFTIQLNGAPKGAPLQAHCTSAQFLLTLELAKFASYVSTMLSISRVAPTYAATATSAPRVVFATGSSVSGSTIAK